MARQGQKEYFREKDKDYAINEKFPFEQAWVMLNLTGFERLPRNREYVQVPGKFETQKMRDGTILQTIYPLHRSIRWKKHRDSKEILNAIEWGMTDKYGLSFSKKRFYGVLRDKRIPIAAPEVCRRCSRTGRLQRDHKKPLHLGGRDVSENLQYLCEVCHKFKTAEDKVLKELQAYKDSPFEWRALMWSTRLQALRRLNSPGAQKYVSYWEDPKTHWDYWKVRQDPRPEILDIKLKTFCAPVLAATTHK